MSCGGHSILHSRFALQLDVVRLLRLSTPNCYQWMVVEPHEDNSSTTGLDKFDISRLGLVCAIFLKRPS